jgi:hypothetical protein
MCRNIKVLFNFDPTATEEEVRNASVQYVRKISGSTKPSKANEDAFNKAVEEITKSTQKLLNSLSTTATPRNREVEADKAKLRAQKRFHN